MGNRGYKNRDIKDEINKKIVGFNRTRDNRIHASERLYSYSEKWETVFFGMNILAVLFLIFSLMNGESKERLFISSSYSLYTVILQYFYSTLNYKERALKFHYQQLKLEELILELKRILRVVHNKRKLEIEFNAILQNYILTVLSTENHSRFDDAKVLYNKSDEKNFLKKPRDFSIDNIIFYINIIITLFVTYIYYKGSIV